MEFKVIRTREQYQAYLPEVHSLIMLNPAIGSPESDRLELLSVLIEDYETKQYPIEAPDPIDAILFRMHEKGLKQADLAPYFGTTSRVSEVLNRKRALTVDMIRALSVGLGLSVETLIGLSNSKNTLDKNNIDWSKFPVKEMKNRGWLKTFLADTAASTESIIQKYIAQSGLQIGSASFKRKLSGDAQTPNTMYALYAWLARVILQARDKKDSLGKYDPNLINSNFLRELAQLSWFEHGPILAIEYLEKHGIAVVIEPHLKGTHLDGAALKDSDGTPIIGLSLRYDRLDNFWFTLLHECAHIWKHVDETEAFLDDLDSSSMEDRREAEANRLAREAFIPRGVLRRTEAFISPSKESIEKLAKELRVHPAIIAGRIRKELGNYTLFSDLVGQYQVKALLTNSHLLSVEE
ncbi:MAG TPA: hypothetical protein DF293_03240 [Acinetobacter nosocomialis]|nr:hypothetical protein [Acinetobacter nosocomialis]